MMKSITKSCLLAERSMDLRQREELLAWTDHLVALNSHILSPIGSEHEPFHCGLRCDDTCHASPGVRVADDT